MSMTTCPACGSADLEERYLNDVECNSCGRFFYGGVEQASVPPHHHGEVFGTTELVSESDDHTRVFVIGLLLGWFLELVTFVIGAIIWGN